MKAETERHVAALQRAVRINDFCIILGISRTSAYGLINRNEVQTIHIAGRRLIPMSEVDRLMAEAINAPRPSTLPNPPAPNGRRRRHHVEAA